MKQYIKKELRFHFNPFQTRRWCSSTIISIPFLQALNLQRQRDTDVALPCFQERFERIHRPVFHSADTGVTPGVAAIEQHKLVAAVENDIPRLRGNLAVTGRK